MVSPGARWLAPADDAMCIAWVRRCAARMAAGESGRSYVNFITERSGRERDAYGRNHERLAALKARYDPSNLFRHNQNVPPAG